MTETGRAYQSWTRQALISRILELEKKPTLAAPVLEQRQSVQSANVNEPGSNATHDSKRTKQAKIARPFQMADYPQRMIALKFAYLGWPYNGLASQLDLGDENDKRLPAVEDVIFKALHSCRLVGEDRSEWNYSKCGRTDRGVSAMGQVIALKVRSIRPGSDAEQPLQEIPYIDTLNGTLPPTIRFYAWTDVDENFSARFSCTSRHYKYFFIPLNMDLDAMRQAASYLLGEQDFRNFCKFDATKQLTSYRRKIFRADISLENDGIAVLDLVGSSFLWHMVRCIMAILLLVGSCRESPLIIAELLNIEKNPRKPGYELASDLPLVLFDCHYDSGPPLDWHTDLKSEKTRHAFWASCTASWHEARMRERMTRLLVNTIRPNLDGLDAGLMDGDGIYKLKRRYIPLLQRSMGADVFAATKCWAERRVTCDRLVKPDDEVSDIMNGDDNTSH